jgi:hypothetical protein
VEILVLVAVPLLAAMDQQGREALARTHCGFLVEQDSQVLVPPLEQACRLPLAAEARSLAVVITETVVMLAPIAAAVALAAVAGTLFFKAAAALAVKVLNS